MFHIIDLLPKKDVLKLRDAVDKFKFEDGVKTADKVTGLVKKNLQASDFSGSDVAQSVMRVLKASGELKRTVFPTTMAPLLLSRYGPGMEYGFHVDSTLMHGGRVRTDLGMTLFLSDPESYEGGELEVQLGNDERSSQLYKLPAGSIVVYPANYLHRVRKVTKGERVAIICWMQSLYRDPEHREIMRQLTDVQQLLRDKHKNSPVTQGGNRALNSLGRMWAGV